MHAAPRRCPARGASAYIVPVIIIALLIAIGLLLANLFGLLTGGKESPLSANGQAQLSQVVGEVSAYLPAVDQWKIIAPPGTTLQSGERMRTAQTGSAVLTLDDGTWLGVPGNSELGLTKLQDTLRAKTADIALTRGGVAVDMRGSHMGAVTLATPLLSIAKAEGVYTMSLTDTNAVDVAALLGTVQVSVLDPQSAKAAQLRQVTVPAGQTLEISEKRVNLLRIGGTIDLTQATTDVEKASPLYQMALSRMAAIALPVVAPILPATTDQATLAPTPTPAPLSTLAPVSTLNPAVQSALGAPVVTTSGGTITATTSPVEVRGTVPADTASVEVAWHNGDNTAYKLKGYTAGSTLWLYRAGIALGNMKPGQNTYSVVAVGADGTRSPATTFTIMYGTDTTTPTAPAPATPVVTPTPAAVPVPTVSGVVPPVITAPLAGSTLTAAPIRFTGTVAADVQTVMVTWIGHTGYQLKTYVPGSGKWAYTADTTYENLAEGQNTYVVTATTKDGAQSTASVTFTYAPGSAPAAPAAVAPASTPATGGSGVPQVGASVSTGAAPTIIAPVGSAVYAAAPIHFTGTVPANTVAIDISHQGHPTYRLQSYVVGSGKWAYTADPKYQNLDIGNNTYTVTATLQDGTKDSATVTIQYAPVQ